MRVLVIRILSILALVIAVLWFIDGGGYESVITAIVGIVGLFSGEFMKGDRERVVVPGAESRDGRPGDSEERPTRDSILVLPFDNISPDPEDAYFSDGLTDEIIMNLSRFNSLRVISRNSTMVLKGSRRRTRDIAEELGVDYVLEGSVRKSGNDLRINAQLIDAQGDEQLWAERYDGVLDDIFGIQEEVSRSIVEALTLTLSPEEEMRLAERPIVDPTAHDCYLRARHEYWKLTPQSLEEAHRHVLNGLHIVGENELLLATLGYVTVQRIHFGIAAGPGNLPEAERLASKVLSINPDSAHGHSLLGWIRYAQGRPADAVAHFQTALGIDPNILEAIAWMTITCLSAGKHQAAAPYVQELIRIDPLTPVNHSLLGYWHALRGESDKAIAVYRRTYEMDPENPWTQVLMGRMMVLLGEEESARGPLERLARGDPDQPLVQHGTILLHLLDGNTEEAAAAITPELEEVSRQDSYLSWWMGDWFAVLGREEESVGWLRRAADLGFINWPVFSGIDLFLDSIREGPVFEEFLEEIRGRWEAFEP
ncbi:MAG: tetratricopeptide repeat protein [Gemmatimonadota bacterium]